MVINCFCFRLDAILVEKCSHKGIVDDLSEV